MFVLRWPVQNKNLVNTKNHWWPQFTSWLFSKCWCLKVLLMWQFGIFRHFEIWQSKTLCNGQMWLLTVHHIVQIDNNIADLLSWWTNSQQDNEKLNNLIPTPFWMLCHLELTLLNEKNMNWQSAINSLQMLCILQK